MAEGSPPPTVRGLDPREASRILEVFHRTRTRLPPVHGVAARPNVRRLASLGRRGRGRHVLNLAQVVVQAGEEAWAQVAPALEGDPVSLQRLRALVDADLRKARAARRPGKGGGPGKGGRRGPRCQGTPDQRRRLQAVLERICRNQPWSALVPDDLELRISRRMTRSLGSCRFRGDEVRITLSSRLFAPGVEDILDETLRHELAHLLDGRTRPDGRSDHGRSWRAWALRVGARPERLCAPDDARRLPRAR
ncbi:MAG: hypothetical protein EA422_09335 [Gemmatimonadales bacterium]|nr:MAG: hypothetical protein EA422_09335 [Gemmatimonadales bacterium]